MMRNQRGTAHVVYIGLRRVERGRAKGSAATEGLAATVHPAAVHGAACPRRSVCGIQRGSTAVSDTINLIREEIAELERLVEDAADQGVPDDDPAVVGYHRELLARRQLAEELEELDRLRPQA